MYVLGTSIDLPLKRHKNNNKKTCKPIDQSTNQQSVSHKYVYQEMKCLIVTNFEGRHQAELMLRCALHWMNRWIISRKWNTRETGEEEEEKNSACTEVLSQD